MPAATRIISLNLGSQTIGLAEFHTQPHGGLTLSGYRFRELLIDPTGEGMRRPQIVAALREMIGRTANQTGNVNYAVSPTNRFSRGL